MEMDLEVVPVLNKITCRQPILNAWRKKLKISSASRHRRGALFSENRRWRAGRSQRLVRDIPPPEGDPEGPLQA